ncbi:MAG: hypothetical protein HY894_05135 [Deltaproteobacteria bacterium]|nr:hypothetical protein [Deltaproteobacteria bacterium]
MKRFIAIALTAAVGLTAGSAIAANLPGTPDSDNLGTYGQISPYSAITVSAYTVGAAANGIQASRHNLGSLGNFISVSASVKQAPSPATANSDADGGGEGGGSSEICVFCHTPHHTATHTATDITNADSGAVVSQTYAPAPLWNRRGVATTYTAYGDTIGGTTVNVPGGVTLACLSCHDGVTAIDNLVNAPGENGMRHTYNNASRRMWTFQDAEGGPDGIDAFKIGQEDRLNIGNGSGITADLSNDHPMSVEYSDGLLATTKKASLRLRSTEISTIDLAAGLVFSTGGIGPELRNNLSQNNWAVKGFISDSATIEDLLRNGKVECSSCHDPHFKNLSNKDLYNSMTGERETGAGYVVGGNGGAAGDNKVISKQDGLFLRRVGGNAGSGVCRTCHNK